MTLTSGVLAADAGQALRYEGVTAQAYRLYEAAFDRTPDAEGLRYWADALDDDGMSLEDVAEAFIDSAEFAQRYGEAPTDEAFVTGLYQNVLDRAPDADGKAYWLAQLDDDMDRDEVLVAFSESPENQEKVAGVVGPDGTLDDILL